MTAAYAQGPRAADWLRTRASENALVFWPDGATAIVNGHSLIPSHRPQNSTQPERIDTISLTTDRTGDQTEDGTLRDHHPNGGTGRTTSPIGRTTPEEPVSQDR